MSVTEKLQARILEVIQEHPEIDSVVGPKTDFRRDLGLDSLMIAEVALDLEDQLDLYIEPADFAKVQRVENVFTLVKPRKA